MFKWLDYLLDAKQFQIEDLWNQLVAQRSALLDTRSSLRQEVARLQRENDELKLYLAAVTRLLIAKGVVAPADLAAMVAVVDQEDGAADGRYTKKIKSAIKPRAAKEPPPAAPT